MKYSLRSIACCCAFCLSTTLLPHISYAGTQTEYHSLPKDLQKKISHITQKENVLYFHIGQAFSEEEKKTLQAIFASSRFVNTITYKKTEVRLTVNSSSFGYILNPTSYMLTLFYDSTITPTMKTVAKQHNGHVATQSKAKQQIKKQGQKIAYKQEHRQASSSIAIAEKQYSGEDITKQIEILERRRVVRTSKNVQYIREAIHYGEPHSLFTSLFGVRTAQAQGTGKQRIYMGGPEELAQSNTAVTQENKSKIQYSSIYTNEKEKQQLEAMDSGKRNIQSIRSTIEHRAPENNKAIQASSPTPVPLPKKEETHKVPSTQEVAPPVTASENTALVHVKEKGDVQDNFKTQKRVAIAALGRGEYEKALEVLERIARQRMSKKEKEELLYLIAEISEVISREKPAFIPKAINNFTVAMNFNLASDNVPNALLQIGLLNGAENNTKEIEAYFNIIRSKYPQNKNVPLTYYYLGKYYQDHKQYSKALKQYKILEVDYPKFEFLQEVIVAMIQCLDALGYYQDIKPYLDFIDGRWPTLYHSYPDILLAKAHLYFDLKEYGIALESYWQYVNILPKAENIDMVYARLGDSYLHRNELEKARSIYKNIINKYKGTEGYVLAKIRLAEDTIIDDITEDAQFLALFDRSFSTLTKDTYTEILRDYPQSSFAPIAHAKLALWYFWMKDYKNTLAMIDSFKESYPQSNLLPSIHSLLGRTLSAMSQDERKEHALASLWEKYKSTFVEDESLQPEHRLAIAQALVHEKKYKVAQDVLFPFFKGRKYDGISESAILLALDTHRITKDWKGIEDIYYRVLDWGLSRNTQMLLLFSTAKAFEAMGAYEKSTTLFQRLLSSVFTTPYYKGVSAYYIAQNGLRELQSPASMYPFAQEALNSLLIALKEKEKAEEVIKPEIIAALVQLRDISQKIQAQEECLRYTILQEQYEPQNMLLQIEKARLVKTMGNEAEWKKILNNIIEKNPSSSYARLARAELAGEENNKSLQGLEQGA